MRNASRSDHSGPTLAAAPARPPPTAMPATPARALRELALTRLNPGGSSRGTAEARVTPYALDATRQPSAAGKSQADPSTTAPASTQHRKALRARVVPIAQ